MVCSCSLLQVLTLNGCAISIDDDFADFQAAPVQAGQPSILAAQAKKPNLMDLIGSTPASSASVNSGFAVPQPKPPMTYGLNTQGMTAGGSGHRPRPSLSSTAQLTPVASQPPLNLLGNSAAPLRPTPMAMSSTISAPTNSNTDRRTAAPAVKSSSNFDDLWNLSLGSSVTPVAGAGAGKSIKDLEKERATAGLWGAGQKAAGNTASFGSFNAAAPSGGGMDDLLL